jgi:hypothetical protein
MNENNVSTALDNTSDDIQEARDDNGCDDTEEEDDNEGWSYTHSMGDSLMTIPQFPHLSHTVRQYLLVSASSGSPERLFNSVELVKSDLWGRFLDTHLIDVM